MASDVSVAGVMETPNVLGRSSAAYAEWTALLETETQRILQEKLVTQAEARMVLLPLAFKAEEERRLSELYPEFRLVFAHRRPGLHSAFEGERMLAVERARATLRRYAATTVVLADATLNVMLQGDESAHVEYSAASAVSVHAMFQAFADYTSLASSPAEYGKLCGVDFDVALAKRFKARKVFNPCKGALECQRKAEGLVVDLSVYPMGQRQFVAAMETAQAQVGIAVIPYHADMFFRPEGDFPGTDVGYKRGHEYIEMQYTAGQVGAPLIRADVWHQWLSRSRVEIGESAYEVELRDVRGNFALAMVTRVASHEVGIVEGAPVRHALEMPWAEKRVVVVCDELKSLTDDPRLATSWKKDQVHVYEERIVVSLYLYAMSLKREDFTSTGLQALMKRAYVADNRVTFGGGYVSVTKPLTVVEARRLVSAVFARAFVDRYEMGVLADTLLSELKGATAFVTATRATKAGMVLAYIARQSWAALTGGVSGFVRGLVVSIREFFSPQVRVNVPVFGPASSFVAYDEYVGRWVRRWRQVWQGVSESKHVVPGVRGSVRVLAVYGLDSRAAKVEVPLLDVREEYPLVPSDRGMLDTFVDMSEGQPTGVATSFVDIASLLDALGDSDRDRFLLPGQVEPDDPEMYVHPVSFEEDPDYVATINEVHECGFPGMARQDFEQDPASLHYDPQDRHFEVSEMVLPLVSAPPPGTDVYKSKIKTYAVEKRMQTLPEVVSALAARTLAAPVISEPQDMPAMVTDAWENFLKMACRPEAQRMLSEFQADRVGFENEVLREWTMKARPESLETLKSTMETVWKSVEEIPVHEYHVMLKADAKPPMSGKPMGEQVAPQMIAYQDKHVSALFSSILRVMTRRFLALLKPNWSVSMLKDAGGVATHFAKWCPWENISEVWFLENDFSKYDKSQAELATMLKEHAYRMLGFDLELLERWMYAQRRATLTSLSLMIKLVVDFQQKSGDGGTSFANVLVNIVAVCFAYRGTTVDAAAFVGDDSAVMSRAVAADERSLRIMAEVFNLSAKFFVTSYLECGALYFASCLFRFDEEHKSVHPVPDPVKRAERLSVSVSAKDPRWDERWESYSKDCDVYRRSGAWRGIERAVLAHYGWTVDPGIGRLIGALATAASGNPRYRDCWEDVVSRVRY